MIKTYVIALIVCFHSSWAAASRLTSPLDTLINTYQTQPNQPAEILEKRIAVNLDHNMLATTTVYIAVRINDNSAIDDYSQINLEYNNYFEDLTLDFANVRTKDGKQVSVREDAIQVKSESNENFHVDAKSLAFSLPLLYIGSVIEYQYTVTQLRNPIQGEFYDGASMHHWERKSNHQEYRADFVHFSEYTLHTPQALKIYYYTPPNFSVEHKEHTTNKIQTHQWIARNINPIKLQKYIPPGSDIAPYIKLSTMPSWKNVVEWSINLIEPKIISNLEIKSIAEKIRSTNNDKASQLRAVYSYMQKNIRYVFAHVGRGGYEPHLSSEIITNGYGDCKDQTVLTIALLRELGIEAYPALVATANRGQPNEKIVNIPFDHMITYIPEQNKLHEAWIDTVGGNFLYPGISDSVNKQKALPIMPTSDKPVTIKNTLGKPNKITLNINVSPPENGLIIAKFSLQTEGEIESSLRSWLRYLPDQEDAIKKLLANLFSKVDIKNTVVNNLDNFEQEVSITGDFIFEHPTYKKSSPFSFGFNISRLANIFALTPVLETPEERLYPISINSGYQINSHVIISKPAGYYVNESSNAVSNEQNSAYTYSHNIQNDGAEITADQQLTLLPIKKELNEYKNFYNDLKPISDQFWSLSLLYDEGKSAIENTLQDLAKNETEASHIKLINLLLDNGEYQDAIVKTEEALRDFPKSGNLFYLQGLAYSYSGNDEKANKSFNSAEKFGHDI